MECCIKNMVLMWKSMWKSVKLVFAIRVRRMIFRYNLEFWHIFLNLLINFHFSPLNSNIFKYKKRADY